MGRIVTHATTVTKLCAKTAIWLLLCIVCVPCMAVGDNVKDICYTAQQCWNDYTASNQQNVACVSGRSRIFGKGGSGSGRLLQ